MLSYLPFHPAPDLLLLTVTQLPDWLMELASSFGGRAGNWDSAFNTGWCPLVTQRGAPWGELRTRAPSNPTGHYLHCTDEKTE